MEKKTLYLICNAHLDPVWLWNMEEGISAALSTFHTASYSYVSSFPLPARYSPGWDGRNRCRPDAPVCLPPTPRPWHVTAHRARLPHPFQSTYNVSEYGHGAGPCSPFRSAGDAGATYSLPLVAQVIWDSRTNQIVLPYCSSFINELSISVNHGRD